ncbi:MAG: cellulase family glycosylhydrolase [Thermomicrobiales bacterium]
MEPSKIDDLSRALVTTEGLAPSRRSLLSGLAGLAGGLAAFTGLSLLETDAKKKRQAKGRKSKSNAHKHNAADTDAEKKKKKKKCKGKRKRQGKCGPKPPGGGGGGGPTPYTGPVFTVSGPNILDTDGDPITIRGVNKMSVFDDDDFTGTNYFPAIKASGANSVRIVWAINDDVGPTTVSQLDSLITNCRANNLLPMIELHDATGNLPMVPQLVDYWVRDDVRTVIFKHSAYLLLNIANEAGDDTVTAQQWVSTYTDAVKRLRAAQIRVPLVIDAPDFGKNLQLITPVANQLLAVDSQLIFSVHPYWGIDAGANATFIENQFTAADNANFALVLGEFSKWGAFNPDAGKSICEGKGLTDYQNIVNKAEAHGFGWYAWEWGPGNKFGDDTGKCIDMDMTGTVANPNNNVLRNVDWVNFVKPKLAAAPAIFG